MYKSDTDIDKVFQITDPIVSATLVFNAMLYYCIKNDGRTWQDYIITVDTAAGLETLHKFELGLEECGNGSVAAIGHVVIAKTQNGEIETVLFFLLYREN